MEILGLLIFVLSLVNLREKDFAGKSEEKRFDDKDR